MNTNTMELNLNEMTPAAGCAKKDYLPKIFCTHRENSVRLGPEREDSRFILWSQHQYLVHCYDCGHDIWIDAD